MTLLSLLTNPQAYRRLQVEIDEAAASPPSHSQSKRISSPITNEEALQLPYLQAVIREGLRVHPPVAGLGYKQVPPEGDTLSGMFVPGGTQIGHNFFGVGRSKRLWGDDADVFRPERWLEAEPQGNRDRLQRMKEAVDLVFGFGKYSCLGKPIAMMELNKVFVEVRCSFPYSGGLSWSCLGSSSCDI